MPAPRRVPDHKNPAIPYSLFPIPYPSLLPWFGWLAATAALTAGMWAIRAQLDEAHVALTYLLLVLAGSVRGSRARGIALALLSFLCFNFFFLPPHFTLAVTDGRDWMVLITFLAVAAVATHLIHRARTEAEDARRRAAEVNRLSALGAETLNAGRAEDALHAVADVIRTTLRLDACAIYLPGAAEDELAPDPPPPPGAEIAAEQGVGVVERMDGTLRLLRDAHPRVPDLPEVAALSLPLRVRERTVGVLRIARAAGLQLDAGEQRFFAALSYYAALGAERVRLAAEAERAEALREADGLKDAVIASVSHDLRTPLTTIKALAHDIAAEGDGRAATIEDEADRLNAFVADLLDLSRLTAGALELRPELTAAEDLVGAALQRASGSLAGRDVRVEVDEVDGGILLGRFDFVHSLRVLVNLLENAHKYSPPLMPIELSAGREDGRLVFRVADRGPGIPPAEAEHAFAPFYRARGALPDAGGAGLGLSIARRLAEAQGGALEYLPRPGGGSVFVFSLPAADVNPASLS
jgi:two-component system sensor histidine kinase KdpD